MEVVDRRPAGATNHCLNRGGPIFRLPLPLLVAVVFHPHLPGLADGKFYSPAADPSQPDALLCVMWGSSGEPVIATHSRTGAMMVALNSGIGFFRIGVSP